MGPLGWTARCPGSWKSCGNQLNLTCGVAPLEVGHTAILQRLIRMTVILARKWAHHVLCIVALVQSQTSMGCNSAVVISGPQA